MPLHLHPSLVQWLTRRSADAGCTFPGLKRTADWKSILEDAHRHCLIPLLYCDLEGSAQAEVPEDLARELKRAAAAIAAKNLLLSSELIRMLRAAKARSLSCVPLRGVVLGELLYGNIALRPTGDLDVLVRQEELSEIRGLLRELGFVEVEARAGFAREFYYTLEFFKARHGTIIAEPHWSIAYPPFTNRIAMPGVWQRCVAGEICGVKTRLLGPEDLLIHLCLHFLHHRNSAPFLWLYELDRVIRSSSCHWPLVLSVAQEARLEPLLHSVLQEVTTTFQTPIPPGTLQSLARGPSEPFERKLVHFLTDARQVKGRERLAMLLTVNGVVPKIRYAAAFLFPSIAFIRAQYGVTSWWQVGRTYLARLCRLLWAGLKGAIKLLTH